MRLEASGTDSNHSGKEVTSDDDGLILSDPGLDLSQQQNVGAWKNPKHNVQCLLCNWVAAALTARRNFKLHLKPAAWPLFSISQGIVHSCVVKWKAPWPLTSGHQPCLLLSASELDEPRDVWVMYLHQGCWDSHLGETSAAAEQQVPWGRMCWGV